jgi:hypothetical protein
MKTFKPFKIGGKDGIFNISTGRDVIIRQTKSGTIPLISHQHENNGITKYIEQLPDRRLFNYKDTISLADRGVFYATTQKENFHIGTRVKALTFKDGEKSEHIRLFFVTAINKLQKQFEEYLTNATDKLPDLSIMLPVNANNEIDYDFIENLISKLEEERISEFSAYLSISGLENYNLTPSEEDAIKLFKQSKIRFKTFKLGEGDDRLFDITSPKKRFNANTVSFDGKYPYVVRSSVNNGIRGYITEDTRYLNEANTISFGQDTATIFYQEKAYFTGDKIKIMTYRDCALYPELACYLLTVMRKAFKNFTWGQSSFNENILKNMEVSLPIKSDDKIDYDFINIFIKAQEKLSIKNVVEWRDKKISITKECI